MHALARFFESDNVARVSVFDSSLDRSGGFGVDLSFFFRRYKGIDTFRVRHISKIADFFSSKSQPKKDSAGHGIRGVRRHFRKADLGVHLQR